MHSSKALSLTAALALAAILFVPAGTFARGAGGFAARGPVFDFHPRVVHRPFRPAHINRAFARLGWQLRRNRNIGGRNRDGAGTAYGGGWGGSYPSDVTGTVPEAPAVYPPPLIPPAPAERTGCLSHGYDVPAEAGGVTRVTVIRC
jgi:hypothetical protein